MLNKVESAAAKMMPPGFPFHCSANIDIAALTGRGFRLHQRTAAIGAPELKDIALATAQEALKNVERKQPELLRYIPKKGPLLGGP